MCIRFGPGMGKTRLLLAAFALVLVFYSGCRGAAPVKVISGKEVSKKINLEELPENILKLQTDRSECKITYIAK